MWRMVVLVCALWQSPVWATEAYEHALVIGVSKYADPEITELTGVPLDINSAREIAGAMGIPANNVTVLRDEQATKANIVAELDRINRANRDGGRVLLYFSGHGTRWHDPQAKGCVEGLLTYDRQVIVNREWATLTERIGKRADQLIVMFDACHSQGVTNATRSLGGGMRAKFFMKANNTTEACSQPVNLRTRSLLQASTALGALQENVVHITSSRPDEVSFDEPGKGGLATQGVRNCLLGQAQDLDGSGGISLAEVEHCAQRFVRKQLEPHKDLIAHHVSVSGFRNLVPVAVPVAVPVSAPVQVVAAPQAAQPRPPSAEQVRAEKERLRREQQERQAAEAAERAEAQRQRQALEQAALQAQADEQQRQQEAERLRVERDLAAAAAAQAAAMAAAEAAAQQAAAEPAPQTPPVQTLAAPTPSAPMPPEVTALATLRDLEQQRDRRHRVVVKLDKPTLRIGQDFLNMQITAPHDGHVYVVMMGSDERSFYVLFPNSLDTNNRVRAGQTLRLPAPTWQLQAAGPAGTNQLLVMVTRQPRQLQSIQAEAAEAAVSPFVTATADAAGRQRLQRTLLGSGTAAANRFSAQRITVEEVQ